jgi:hypothetical protein
MTWGTDVDILAFAAYLRITINVYREHGTSGIWCWHSYKPSVFIDFPEYSNGAIYIQNTNGNHYDVVTAIDVGIGHSTTAMDTFLPTDVEWQKDVGYQLSMNHNENICYENTSVAL